MFVNVCVLVCMRMCVLVGTHVYVCACARLLGMCGVVSSDCSIVRVYAYVDMSVRVCTCVSGMYSAHTWPRFVGTETAPSIESRLSKSLPQAGTRGGP